MRIIGCDLRAHQQTVAMLDRPNRRDSGYDSAACSGHWTNLCLLWFRWSMAQGQISSVLMLGRINTYPNARRASNEIQPVAVVRFGSLDLNRLAH
jgi:hypothetical protein